MSRTAVALSCSAPVLEELKRMARGRGAQAQFVERARIVLACLQGKRNDLVARELGLEAATVARWRKRFAENGIEGLQNKPRAGRPPWLGPEFPAQVLAQLSTPPPEGKTGWTGAALARALGVHPGSIQRVLRLEGIELERPPPLGNWRVETAPEFGARALTLLALYLSPRNNALVLGADERPAPAAFDPAPGQVRTGSGEIALALKGRRYRQGAQLTLCAMLANAAAVMRRGKSQASGKAVGFHTFLNEITADLPAGCRVHAILDHRSSAHNLLAAHPGVVFHLASSHAAWLSQVQTWLAIFAPASASGTSPDYGARLAAAIEDFGQAWDDSACPFVWQRSAPPNA